MQANALSLTHAAIVICYRVLDKKNYLHEMGSAFEQWEKNNQATAAGQFLAPAIASFSFWLLYSNPPCLLPLPL